MRTAEHAISWEEVWSLTREIEARWGRDLTMRVYPPRNLTNGTVYRPRVGVSIDYVKQKSTKTLTRYCEIGGVRGAKNAAAAFHRALSEVYWALEELSDDAAAQAAF